MFLLLARMVSFIIAIGIVLLVVIKAPSNYGPSITIPEGDEDDSDQMVLDNNENKNKNSKPEPKKLK